MEFWMEFMSIKEVAAQLRLGTRRVYDLAATGAIPSVHMRRRVLVPRAAWEQWYRDQVSSALTRCSANIGHSEHNGDGVGNGGPHEPAA